MHSQVTVLLAGLLGLLTGIVAVMAFRWSQRQLHRMPPAPMPPVDAATAQVLAVLRSAVVVLDGADDVIRASAAAHAFGLVRRGRLHHAEIAAMVSDARRTGEIRDEELTLPRGPVGLGTIIVQVRVAMLPDSRVLVLADDRTESHRLEEIRRDFVANVSHELKTPVGAIQLLAETVQSAADDPDAVRRFAGRMEKEATRLGALVQEIIELSRLQVVDAFAELTSVSIDEVIHEAVDRVRTPAHTSGVELEEGTASGLTVWGDKGLLVTAVRNLLDNAVHYSAPGTHVGVGARLSGTLVEVAVVDQGIGITSEEQERIFERFYRVDAARSRATGGTGLGLSIVKHIASNHGGEVTVWSRPGHGSTFTLRLPVRGQDARGESWATHELPGQDIQDEE